MGSDGTFGTIKLIEPIPFLSGKMLWTLDSPYGLTNAHINPPGMSSTPTMALMLNPIIIEKSQEDKPLKLSSNFNAKYRSIYPTKLPIGGFVESQKKSSDVHSSIKIGNNHNTANKRDTNSNSSWSSPRENKQEVNEGYAKYNPNGDQLFIKISILQCNIGGAPSTRLSPGMPLRMAIQDHRPSFVALTETKTRSNKIPALDGYECITLDPFELGSSGGVALYYRKLLCYTVSIALSSTENSLLWIRLDNVDSMKKVIYIAVVYAPTATPYNATQRTKIDNFYDELNTTIPRFQSKGHVLLVGDFNARLGVITGDHASNRNKEPFLNCLDEHRLTNVNVTHCWGQYTFENQSNLSRSIIDFLVTDLPTSNIKSHRVLPIIIGTSSQTAHHPLLSVFQISAKCESTHIRYRPKWRGLNNLNTDKFLSALQSELEMLQKLPTFNGLRRALNRAKTRTLGRMKTKPKICREPPELVRLQHRLAQALIKLQKCHTRDNIMEAQDIERKLREAKAKLESKSIHSFLDKLEELHQTSKMRLFYRRVKEKTTIKPKPTYVIHDPNTSLGNPTFSKSRNEFLCFWRDYFENIFKTSKKWKFKYPANKPDAYSIDVPLTMEEVERAMNTISTRKRNKAPGFDEITNEDLQYIYEIKPTLIFKILQNIWKTGECPSEFKQCIIHLIPKASKVGKKRKDHRFQKNHRPIALLSSLRKLYEIILADRIINRVLLTECQFGFRQRRSTLDCLFLLREIILEARYCSRGKRGGSGPQKLYAAFLDFKSAFDLVPRELVWEKLRRRFGINGKLLSNVIDLFSDMKGRVQLNGSLTSSFKISTGVVQGSVLGPFLFVLFIDDLLEELQTSGYAFLFSDISIAVLAYADDLTLLSANPSGLRKLLLISNSWAKRNGMVFSVDKCYVVIFNSLSKKPGPIFMLDEHYLVTHYPPTNDQYLGLTLSDHITITKIAQKTNHSKNLKPNFRKKPYPNYLDLLKRKFRRARAGTLIINPESNVLQPNISIELYKSITRSTLLYACEVTDFDCDQMLSLEILQADTLRCMLNLDKRCPKALVRLITGVEPLEARFNFHKIMYYIKLSNSDSNSLLHAVHKIRKTAFGATPLGFHHTCYNILR